jgi:hypothetical protein
MKVVAEILFMERYWVQNVLEIFMGFQSLLPDGRLEVAMCPQGPVIGQLDTDFFCFALSS